MFLDLHGFELGNTPFSVHDSCAPARSPAPASKPSCSPNCGAPGGFRSAAGCVAAICFWLVVSANSEAQAANLTTTNVQLGGANWTAAIWKTNGTGTAVAPMAGNTYECVPNGAPFGNNLGNTRIRNPAAAGLQTFPGDSLKLDTNTELRMKASGAVLSFPGVGSNPGLILNGGVLNVGDDAVFTVTGKIQVVSQSYISPGDNGGGAVKPLRGVDLTGELTGSGTLVFIQASNTVAQRISGIANTFQGKWILKAGWLLVAGANSLGTNDITIDPGYVLPLDPSVVEVRGPALFEPGYNVNSAGVLTLTNGGVMKLHQNCTFAGVRIEGVALSPGTHYYPELAANFPNSFAAGGSGSLIVQAFGPVAPGIVQQPPPFVTAYEGSATQLVVAASGDLPLYYQWQKGTNSLFVKVSDSGGVSGSSTPVLSFGALTLADSTDYRVLVTNSAGVVTSQLATLTVLVRDTEHPSVATLNPAAGTTVGSLTQIQVTFSEEVVGVMADDLQINGTPAAYVSGSGSNYLFTFSPPSPGTVVMSWDENAISDLFGNAFDAPGPWTYALLDNIPPAIATVAPVTGATVSRLTQAQVIFSEPVTGVSSETFLVNGQPATNVAGSGLGPYVFDFPQPAQGTVQFSWATGHGIRDTGGNLFPGSGWVVSLDSAAACSALTNLVINEFLAANISTNGLADEDLELNDWLELYNRGNATVSLTGWSLTDTPQQPSQWVFPATNIGPYQFLVIFASGKNRRTAGARLHTNFKLGTAGDYLALFNSDYPPQAAHAYAPQYPEQRTDISYGLDSAGVPRYFAVQTPGASNSSSTFTGAVAAVHFSVGRGFFNQPFALILSVPTRGATIRYTADGSPPTETSEAYVSPLNVSGTTILRAAAFAPGQLPSLIQTHTYIFPAEVVHQPSDPPGFPVTTSWSQYGWPSDYGMDQSIVTNPLYSASIEQDLLSLPALSIVMRTEDMFGAANGLYTHADNLVNEAPCSVEIINPDGSTGCQCDAGIKMHGGGSRYRTLKHPFRLLFQGKYGPAKLDFPLFPDSPVRQFDQIDLRSDYNDHWTHGFDASQRARGGLVRDAFFKDLQARMGGFSSHSRYVHLYVNGLYWGVYNPCERPNASFAASYLGGDVADYDAFNGTGAQLADGTTVARNEMLSLNTTNLASIVQYEGIQQYLDIPQYIDYMIGQLYGANWDWGSEKNWYSVRLRQPGAGFKYLYWDSERTLEGVNDQVNVSPDNLQANLILNPEYRLAFADHVQRHFFNGGALTPEALAGTWLARAAQIDRAIVGESARWGDSVPNGKVRLSPLPYPGYTTNTPYTRNENWLGEQGRLLTNYFPYRSGVVLTQFMQAGLFPRVAAPVFSQHGGRVPVGYTLTMSPTNAVIYFTTDGSDPRVYNIGTPVPSARVYSNGVTLTNDLILKARVLSAGTWSALTEAMFTVSGLGLPIRITEIMYHPVGGEAYEFIELQNVGALPLDLSGFSFVGITFVVPDRTVLAPGTVVVIGSSIDPAAFASRYPGVLVAGWYGGQLSNSGERIALLDRNGSIVTSVEYGKAAPWPIAADGGGYSLEIIDANGDPNDPANWRVSAALNGSPGLVNPPAGVPSVRINELMADNAGAVTNGGAFPDWLELYNAGSSPVSLSDWSLSNNGDPRRFVFPSGTTVAGNGYLVIWCDSQLTGPGLHTGFALGRKGESVFLYDSLTNRVDAVGFGLQPADFSLGRVGPTGRWQLTVPTPWSNNVAATLAPTTNLVINEWLANSAPASPDWIEVMNASASLPASLSGLFFATSNSLFQFRSLSFVAPGGFAQLFADEQPGPDHLGFKLSAQGDSIVLYDASGQLLDAVRFAGQAEGVSEGRLPNGSATLLSFPGTASPGASNYVLAYSGPVLNEVMARNVSAVYDPYGDNPDWLEIYNPNTTNYSLEGMILSADPSPQAGWVFPAGASISAGSCLVIWCDSSKPGSTNVNGELNTGFALKASGGGLYLFNSGGQIVDSITFGFQVADLSIGRSGGSWALLSAPTPGWTNESLALLGSAYNLRINEWMAAPLSGANWVELYNRDSRPIELTGLYLTDDPSIPGVTKFAVPALSFIAPHGWVKYEADSDPGQGPNHLNFKLDRLGETIRLYDGDLGLIDAVDFGLQASGVSQGQLPDGASNVVPFVSTPTPEASNYLPLNNVVVNEILSHTDPPLEDAIELYNSGPTDVVLDGWFLSNSQADFKKYQIHAGSVLRAGNYAVFYEYQFNSTNAGPFTLNSAHGDFVYLSQADGLGNLTGYRAQTGFGAAENGISWGRFVTSAGEDFVPLAGRTFGADNPSNLTQFRSGTGLTNAAPRIGPVVINEVMFHPVTWQGTNATENPDEEFLELYNILSSPAELYDPAATNNVWKVSGGVEFRIPPGTILPAHGFALLVGFDPQANPAALVNFQAKYGLSAGSLILGPFNGRLNNAGETIELYKPDRPQAAPHPDAGFVPYILMDRVSYQGAPSWPAGADGTGNSLQRVRPGEYGNEPLNWLACSPTPGGLNCGDSDRDGLPDAWETRYGLDPNSAVGANGATGDPDGDGFTNLQEYLAGTDPRDAGSCLKIDSAERSSGGVIMHFSAVAARTYSIQYTDDVNDANWQKLTDAGPFSANLSAEVLDPASSSQSRFYRLVTPALP